MPEPSCATKLAKLPNWLTGCIQPGKRSDSSAIASRARRCRTSAVLAVERRFDRPRAVEALLVVVVRLLELRAQEIRQLVVVARVADEGRLDRVELQVFLPVFLVERVELRGERVRGVRGAGRAARARSSDASESRLRVMTNYSA